MLFSVASLLKRAMRKLLGRKGSPKFSTSPSYWEARYAQGGNGATGRIGRLADFKAEVLNALVRNEKVRTVVELGCGDGSQLTLAEYPAYLGLDIAPTAVAQCRARFAGDATKRFAELRDAAANEPAELSLSLDVIYHLVEDPVFDDYMRRLFGLASRLVVVYASNHDEQAAAAHVRHRRFTDWVEANAPAWRLRERIANRYPFDAARPKDTSFADFYIFEKRAD